MSDKTLQGSLRVDSGLSSNSRDLPRCPAGGRVLSEEALVWKPLKGGLQRLQAGFKGSKGLKGFERRNCSVQGLPKF